MKKLLGLFKHCDFCRKWKQVIYKDGKSLCSNCIKEVENGNKV